MKSDTILQLFIICIIATIFSLASIRFYPAVKASFHRTEEVKAAEAVNPLAETKTETTSPVTLREKVSPNLITFPSLALSLTVAEAQVTGNTWTLFDDKVSWLKTSEEPGEGNVIIYGHNRRSLFGRLRELELGDEIALDHHGETYTYLVTEKRKVVPTDVDAILSSRDQLTLYTCDGAFDQKRLVVTALSQKRNSH